MQKGIPVDSINNFFNWLFGTKPGVIALMVGGILLFVVISYFLEKGTKAKFYNHEKSEGDFDLFDTGEE